MDKNNHVHHKGCGCAHEPNLDLDHQLDSLYSSINIPACTILNASPPHDKPQNILRPHDQKHNTQMLHVKSDADEQLLLCVRFVSPVKIKAIEVIGTGGAEDPKTCKLFINKESMDFHAAESTQPIQTLELVPSNSSSSNSAAGPGAGTGTGNQGIDYPTKYTKFQNVSTLWMFFQENYGAEHTEIQYVGFKGVATLFKREAVAAVYELRPLPAGSEVKSNNHNVEFM